MKYYSDDETEKRLAELEKKIREEYSKAYQEASASAAEYFQSFKARYDRELEAYKGGAYTEEEFHAWVYSQIGRGERWNNLKSDMAEKMTRSNEIAAAYINDTTPGIYSLNHNFEAYQISEAYPDAAFNIYDEQTIRQLMKGENHTEFRVTRTNPSRDYEWNSKQIESALISGILQGKPVDKIADSFFTVMKRDRSAAIRNARTAVTSAQNSGRQQAYEEAEQMGIDLQKEWIATFDDRTRDTHGALDGVRVGADESWETFNGHVLRYPGDPEGEPSEVYNCRCTTRAVLKKINDKKRRTYTDWLEAQKAREEEDKAQAMMSKIEASEFAKEANNDVRLEDIDARKHTPEDLAEMKAQIETDKLTIVNIQDFDGDPELLIEQAEAIKTIQKEYNLPALEIKLDNLGDGTPGQTNGSTIYLNTLALRNREQTENFLNCDKYFAGTKAEAISIHELGHQIDKENKGLDVLRLAYYNIYKEELKDEDVRSFLRENISIYAAEKKQNKPGVKSKYFKEITSEMLSKNRTNPDELTEEFERLLKKEVLKK